jgi:hypothetical protein
MQGTSIKPKALCCRSRSTIGAAVLMANLIFPLLPIVSRAADIPDAVIERALQIPGADASVLQLVESNSPFQYGYGTYWSVQRYPWPPLPFNWLSDQEGISVYSAGPGVFLVDDRSFDYDGELLAQTIFTALEMDGGGGGDGGTPLYATNDLWLELVSTSILSPTNLSASLVVHTPEIYGVYDLFFKTSLSPSNAWYWVARGLPGQTNFYLVNLPVDGGFFILGTTNFTDTNALTAAYRGLIGGTDTLTNDFDHDGLPDYWEILNFGDLRRDAGGDYDSDGQSNGAEYANGSDPNDIVFSLQFASRYINSNSATGDVVVAAGVPASMTGIVNSTNFVSASWRLYGSNVVVSLGTNDGDYAVWVGLRGRGYTSNEIWREFTLTRDTVPPLLVITSTVPGTTARPLLQLEGYSTEPLSTVTFNLTNAAGFLTNQAGYLVAQYIDTNTLKFTTNWFHCYDIPLTNGSNIISLRGADLAGNVTITNLTIALDLSLGTNAPSFTVLWPPDDSLVAGTNFTLWGSIDDDTASVTVSGSGFPPVSGLVERGGQFRVQNLLLAQATNVLTISVTNAAGSGSSQQLTVRKSSVSLTIDPISPGQFSGPTFTLSGTVGDSSQQVFVNGNPATVNPSNNTYGITLPTPQGGGSANIDVAAGPDNSNILARQSVVLDIPSRVRAAAYADSYYSFSQTICDGTPTFITARNRTWEEGVGGGSYEHDENATAPPFTCDSQVQWPAYWPDGQTVIGTSCHGPFTNTLSLPWQNGQFGTRSWFAGEIVDCGFGTREQILQRNAQTAIEIAAGGPAESGRSRLIRLTVSAAGYSPALVNNPNAAGDVPIPASNILFAGEPLTPTATNAFVAEIDLAAASGSVQNLPITVAGTNSQFYSLSAKAEDRTFSVSANGVILGTNNVVTNANFIVGQILTFSTNDLHLPANVASRSVQWTFEGHFLNDSNLPCPDCSTNYTTNSAKLTNDTTTAWWVSGGNPPATYTARLTETFKLSNGSIVSNSAQGLFSILRPLPAFRAEIRDGVHVDTNYFFTSPRGEPHPPGTYLHFGTSSSSANDGIVFIYTNAPLAPDSTTYGQYSLAQVIETYRQRYNRFTNDVCEAGYETNDLHGLDGSYPSLGPASEAAYSPEVWADSPGAALTTAHWLSQSNSFTTYLMFQPKPYSGSVAVPMLKVGWTWSGSATNNPWGIRSGAPSTNNLGTTEDFPFWTHIITAVDTSPENMVRTNCFDEN